MRCKFCGARLSILIRLRHGDFCSREHAEEFVDDLERMNKQILSEFQSFPTRVRETEPPKVEREKPAQRVPVEEPVPPEAWLVPQAVTEAMRSGERAEESQAATVSEPASRQRANQWRLFSKVAEWDGLPPAALESSRKKQSRFVTVEVVGDAEPGPGGCLLPATYPAFLPSPELRRPVTKIAEAGLSAPEPEAAGMRISAPQPATPKCWVDEQGWRWIPEQVEVAVPDFSGVLNDFPMAAPWAEWTITAPPEGQRRSGMPGGTGGAGSGLPGMAGQGGPGGGGGGGYTWTGLPPWIGIPPFFHALVDLAHGMRPVPPKPATPPPCEPFEPESAEAALPKFAATYEFALAAWGLCEMEDPEWIRGATALRYPPGGSIWRLAVIAPRPAGTLPRPRVPRRQAPTIRLAVLRLSGEECEFV